MHSGAILRSISLVISTVFFVQQIAFAAPASRVPALLNIQQNTDIGFHIPESVASVEEVYEAQKANRPGNSQFLIEEGGATPNAALIYLIQDAHTNESGQLNLAKALDLILQNEEIRYVFTEAGVGNNSLSYLKEHADRKTREDVSLRYLRKGLLQGTEYLSAVADHNFVLWGVEDQGLYRKTIDSYRIIAAKREKALTYLSRIETALQALKSPVYSKALAAFDRIHEDYLKESLSLTEYFAKLHAAAGEAGLNLRSYAHLNHLRKLSKLEASIDFEDANREQLKAMEALPTAERDLLAEAAKNETHSPFRVKSNRDTSDKHFYTLFEEKLLASEQADQAHKLYPALFGYFDYLKQARAVDAQAVINEQSSLERRVYAVLSNNVDERLLIEFSENIRILKHFFELKIMPEEFDTYLNRREHFDLNVISGFVNRKIMDLDRHHELAVVIDEETKSLLTEVERFYRMTLERDRIFVARMLKKMQSESQEKAVLVTGGYHTPNIKRLLKREGISYVSVLPGVTHETDHTRYEELLLSQFGPQESESVLAMAQRRFPEAMNAVQNAAMIRHMMTRFDNALVSYLTDIGMSGPAIAGLVPDGSRLAQADPDRVRAVAADKMDEKAIAEGAGLKADEIVNLTGMDAEEKIAEILRLKPEILYLRSATKIKDHAIIDQLAANGLKLIIRSGHGTDNVDAAYAESKGIRVVPTKKSQFSISAWTLRAMAAIKQMRAMEDIETDMVSSNRLLSLKSFEIAAQSKLKKVDQLLQRGLWLKHNELMRPLTPRAFQSMTGRNVGIIGANGVIGQEITKAVQEVFGGKAWVHSRTLRDDEAYREAFIRQNGGEYASWDKIFSEADYIVLITGLTDETRGMVGAREVEMMRGNSNLIAVVNPDRGGLVVEEEMVKLLKDNREQQKYYAIDEIPKDSELKELALYTPHIGGATPEAEAANLKATVDMTREYLAEAGARAAAVVSPDKLSEILRLSLTEESYGVEVKLNNLTTFHIREDYVQENRELILEGFRALRRMTYEASGVDLAGGFSYINLAGNPYYDISLESAQILMSVGLVLGMWRVMTDPVEIMGSESQELRRLQSIVVPYAFDVFTEELDDLLALDQQGDYKSQVAWLESRIADLHAYIKRVKSGKRSKADLKSLAGDVAVAWRKIEYMNNAIRDLDEDLGELGGDWGSKWDAAGEDGSRLSQVGDRSEDSIPAVVRLSTPEDELLIVDAPIGEADAVLGAFFHSGRRGIMGIAGRQTSAALFPLEKKHPKYVWAKKAVVEEIGIPVPADGILDPLHDSEAPMDKAAVVEKLRLLDYYELFGLDPQSAAANPATLYSTLQESLDTLDIRIPVEVSEIPRGVLEGLRAMRILIENEDGAFLETYPLTLMADVEIMQDAAGRHYEENERTVYLYRNSPVITDEVVFRPGPVSRFLWRRVMLYRNGQAYTYGNEKPFDEDLTLSQRRVLRSSVYDDQSRVHEIFSDPATWRVPESPEAASRLAAEIIDAVKQLRTLEAVRWLQQLRSSDPAPKGYETALFIVNDLTRAFDRTLASIRRDFHSLRSDVSGTQRVDEELRLRAGSIISTATVRFNHLTANLPDFSKVMPDLSWRTGAITNTISQLTLADRILEKFEDGIFDIEKEDVMAGIPDKEVTLSGLKAVMHETGFNETVRAIRYANQKPAAISITRTSLIGPRIEALMRIRAEFDVQILQRSDATVDGEPLLEALAKVDALTDFLHQGLEDEDGPAVMKAMHVLVSGNLKETRERLVHPVVNALIGKAASAGRLAGLEAPDRETYLRFALKFLASNISEGRSDLSVLDSYTQDGVFALNIVSLEVEGRKLTLNVAGRVTVFEDWKSEKEQLKDDADKDTSADALLQLVGLMERDIKEFGVIRPKLMPIAFSSLFRTDRFDEKLLGNPEALNSILRYMIASYWWLSKIRGLEFMTLQFLEEDLKKLPQSSQRIIREAAAENQFMVITQSISEKVATARPVFPGESGSDGFVNYPVQKIVWGQVPSFIREVAFQALAVDRMTFGGTVGVKAADLRAFSPDDMETFNRFLTGKVDSPQALLNHLSGKVSWLDITIKVTAARLANWIQQVRMAVQTLAWSV